MQEEVLAATLVLPEAPLYIVVALLVAITAMTAADVRDRGRLLPNTGVNAMALALFLGSWISVSHIIIAMIGRNDFNALSAGAAVGMFAHCLVLVLLLIVVSIWYWVVAIYRETPAGMPTNPAANQ
ncbi:MAG: hypothetical protein OXH45_00850 [Gammaproteobacteria bacterium]|nr:hypothetical protein [Gammaproteobacteria bacterium]